MGLALMAAGVALLVSTICFVLNDVSMIRSSMVKQITILADVLGSDCTAALDFQDADRAREVLGTLQQEPSIEFACIYNAAGQVFATYHQADKQFRVPPAPHEEGFRFVEGGYLDVVQPIVKHGQKLGSILLHANSSEFRDRLQRYVLIVTIMVAFSFGISVLLSSRLQRVISLPIKNLAELAKRVSVERDFGVRVTKVADDELGALCDQFNHMLQQIQNGEAALQRAHEELEAKVKTRTQELSRANESLGREIGVRMQAEKELEATHQKLLDAARRAGMAEIATGVLHNVGNVLNSINVSATLVLDRMRQSKLDELLRATNLLKQHSGDLGIFITDDANGKHLPNFLNLVAQCLRDEHAAIAKELDLLTEKVIHVKTIVMTQQSYAGVSGLIEAVDLPTTLEDALKLNLASFEREQISVTKQYQNFPKLRLDKQKVLQIMVNLIKNAREALCESVTQANRQIIIRTLRSSEQTLQIQIRDNGVGIAQHNLTRIFSHGFTTKKTGHGFGLHSCANAAIEMSGSLSVHSDGPGKGATFTLEIPYLPAGPPTAPQPDVDLHLAFITGSAVISDSPLST
jgi:C4-dicarboxylate-specific signal transduction histidine kinase